MHYGTVVARVLVSAVALVLLGAGPAMAEDVVAESDTGIVFSDLDCRIFDYELGEPAFSKDYFDYLQVAVRVKARCVTRDGRRWTFTGADEVIFPTLTFDWMEQAWTTGGVIVARDLGWRRVELNPELDVDVWTYADETHVTFKVRFKERGERGE